MPIDEQTLKVIENYSSKDAQKFPDLYHYTSMSVFHSMLFLSREIWFSEASVLNDKLELLDFINNLMDASANSIKPENKSKHKQFFYKVWAQLPKQYPYVFCFSKRADDAAQWERYGNNASGICIKFNTKQFSKLFRSFGYVAFLQEVFYNYDASAHQHCGIVEKWIDEGSITGFPNEKALIENIIATSSSYKHKSFMSEDEVRAIILPFSLDNICFEQQNGIVRKVVKLNYFQQCQKLGMDVQDLFEEITIGPRSQQHINTYKEYLMANHFEKLAEMVKKSKCPLR